MKVFFTIAILGLFLTELKAQELEMDSTTKKWMYRGIVTVDSVSAGDLYERGRQWVARAYKSANAVVQYESKEEGKVIAKGNWQTYAAIGEVMEHTLILEFKDGRLRYTFTDFVKLYTKDVLAGTRKTLEDVKTFKKTEKESFARESAKTATDLENSVKISSFSKKDDRW